MPRVKSAQRMQLSPLLQSWNDRRNATSLALIDSEATHMYAEIHAASRRIAGHLLGSRASLGGERIAVLVSPRAEFVAAFFGILLAGGVVVVLSPLHPPPETRFFCEDAEIRRAIVGAEYRDLVQSFGSSLTILSAESITQTESPAACADVAADAPALQLYTSGTTGKPKGAIITHENLGTQQRLLRDAWGWQESDVLLHALPLHHMHGLAIALLSALGSGACVRFLPGFQANAVWEGLSRATVFMAVPTMYHRLFAAFDAADAATQARWTEHARSLRLATSGSAALPVTLAERWRDLTGQIPLERFGMTEIGVGLTNPLHGARQSGHVGMPLPTVACRIVGEDGRDADTGELWIQGPSVFAGYWKRPDATRDAFVDGWFRTGDTVTRNEGGAFRILGRTSVDILKSGGYKLSALEIEEVLREHPSVADAAVVGVPDESWGERVVACVIARPGTAPSEEALRAFCREKLAPYKVPKSVVFFTEMPQNSMGKVVKPELVRLLRDNAKS